MKKLIATPILLGFGTGLAMAEGDSGGYYAYKTLRQVQSGSPAIIDQNGQESWTGR